MINNRRAKISDTMIRFIVFLFVFLIMAIINPTVASIANIATLFNNMIFDALIALALTILMVMNVLDLAVTAYGVVSAFCVLKFCMAFWMDANMWFMLGASAVVGSLCTMLTAWILYKFRIDGFLLSIAMANILHMVMFLKSYNSASVSAIQLPHNMLKLVRTNLFSAQVGRLTVGLNVMVVVVLAIAVGVWYFLNKTTTGRNIFALGGNFEAAERMGIDIRKTYFIAYAIVGALCGIAMMRGYMAQQANVTALGLKGQYGDAMAAVIFGGTQGENGKGGSVAGTMIGVLLITLIRTNLVIIGVPSYAQSFVISMLLMGSVVLSSRRNR